MYLVQNSELSDTSDSLTFRCYFSQVQDSQSINQSNEICIAPPTNSGRRRLTIKTIKC